MAQANYASGGSPPWPFSFPAGDWEGSVFTRAVFIDAPVAFTALNVSVQGDFFGGPPSPVRVLLRDCRFWGLGRALVTLSNATFPASALTILGTVGRAAAAAGVTTRGKSAGPAVPQLLVLEFTEPGLQNRSVYAPAGPGPWEVRSLVARFDVPNPLGIGAPSLPPIFTVSADVRSAPGAVLDPPPTDVAPLPYPVSSWIDAKAAGVVGNGVTDDTVSLIALLREAGAVAKSSGSPTAVYLHTGVYIVNDTVSVPPGVALFGLHCWDVVLRLADDAAGFKDPSAPRPVLLVQSGDDTGAPWPTLRIGGLDIQTATTYASPQPPPVPAGWANPNPGAVAVLWEAGGALASGAPAAGLVDAFFHPLSWPDNVRLGTGNSTETSLWVSGVGAGGSFVDVWACNAYAGVQVRVSAARGAGVFYGLSSEHNDGPQLLFEDGAAGWAVWTLETGEGASASRCPQ